MTAVRWVAIFDGLVLPMLALAGAVLLFGGFVWLGGTDPVETWVLLFQAHLAMPSRGRTPCSGPRR